MARRALIAALVALMVLMLLTVVTTLWPRPANAEGFPSFLQSGDDTIEIRASSEGHVAEIEFKNSTPPGSSFGRKVVQLGDVVVEVYVSVGSQGAERLRVVPSHDLIAVPEMLDVPDGMGSVIQIMRPLF